MIHAKNTPHSTETLHQSSSLKRLVLRFTIAATPFLFVGTAHAQTSSTAVGPSTTTTSTASTSDGSSASTTSATGPSTTVAGSVSTTISASPTTVEVDGTVSTQDTTIDDAVPQGGIDAGFGGTAPAPQNGSDLPIGIAVLLFSGAAAVGVTAGRRSRA
jgi:hypothetical protein